MRSPEMHGEVQSAMQSELIIFNDERENV